MQIPQSPSSSEYDQSILFSGLVNTMLCQGISVPHEILFTRNGPWNISKSDDYDSPRDYRGHGTHTSSIAAGSPVLSASHFNYAKGTATGIAPKAQRAMYKALFFIDTCDSAATDALAMGDFAAMEKGIFVACSAGIGGPHCYTIKNGGPSIKIPSIKITLLM